MAVATETEAQIRPDVSNQKARHAEISELPHVHQLVAQQPYIVGGTFTNDDRASQRDRVGLRRHRTADHQAIPITPLDSHRQTLSRPFGRRCASRPVRRDARPITARRLIVRPDPCPATRPADPTVDRAG